jgi:hypothetical protein
MSEIDELRATVDMLAARDRRAAVAAMSASTRAFARRRVT